MSYTECKQLLEQGIDPESELENRKKTRWGSKVKSNPNFTNKNLMEGLGMNPNATDVTNPTRANDTKGQPRRAFVGGSKKSRRKTRKTLKKQHKARR